MEERKLKHLSDSSDESVIGEQVWCICRRPADGKFMIGCDGCDEWYHGACINISESKSENIVKFYCKKCRRRNPDLKTVFKRGGIDRDRPRDSKTGSHHEKRKKRRRHEDDLERQMRKKIKKRREEIIPNLSDDDEVEQQTVAEGEVEADGSKVPPTAGGGKSREDEKKGIGSTVADVPVSGLDKKGTAAAVDSRVKLGKEQSSGAAKSVSKGCGLCRGCKTKENCGLCSVCLANIGCPIFSGRCKDRVCLGPGSKHTTGPGKLPLKRVRVLSSELSEDSEDSEPKKNRDRPRGVRLPPPSAHDDSVSSSSLSDDVIDDEITSKKKSVLHRKDTSQKHPPSTASSSQRRGAPTLPPSSGAALSKARRGGASLVQCQGPDCVQAARSASKYCSDNCGVALATRRIYEFLPIRLSNWAGSPCVAEERNKQQLVRVRDESTRVHRRLMEMEEEHLKLTHLVQRSQNLHADDEDETTDGDDQEQIVCVTCATEVNLRLALRHMEKCFQKMESNTVFYASHKEQLVGTPLFCDSYDPQIKAYCKRLKVLCEHTKEPKLAAEAVCGFPLIENVFDETGEFCMTAKRKCCRHLGWERLRRAKIDVERYRQLIRMDELVLEERQLRSCLTGRAGVLGLMLHQTLDHDPSNPILVPSSLPPTSATPTSTSKKEVKPSSGGGAIDAHSPPILLGKPATSLTVVKAT